VQGGEPQGRRPVQQLPANHDLSDWLNRIGLILGFFSFWLAAPEFIGEERLRSWEKRLGKLIAVGFPLMVTVAGLIVGGTQDSSFAKAHPVWFAMAFIPLMGLLIAWRLQNLLAEWIVAKLTNDAHVRRSALALGAGLFTVSFVLQLIATFQQH
jgi:hypothetical protein